MNETLEEESVRPPGGALRPLHGLLMLVTLAATLLAQPAVPLPPSSALKKMTLDELMNIEVTSVSKRPERLAETASAIQVITGEDIRSTGATRLPEALRLATNLEVAQIDSHQWAITARGFNNTTANKMLVLLDGRTLYTPLYAGVFWDMQDTLLEDVERIEVISGPGATQWGANAVNGVINVITKSARDTVGSLVSGGGGTELRAFGGVRHGGEARPGVFYRVYAKHTERDESLDPNGRGANDDWRFGQTGFRIDWESAGNRMFTLQGDAYAGKIGQTALSDTKVAGGNLIGRWARTLSSDSSLSLQVYYDRTHRRIPDTATADVDTFDFDFQHRFPAAAAHDVVWGFGYRLVQDDITDALSLTFLPARTTRQWFTGFVQDDIALIKHRLHLALGTKIEHNDYSGFEVQPSVRLAWQLARNQILWGAVSRAIRAPSRIDRELYAPAQPPYVIAGGRAFDSEKLVAYELGYRFQPSSRWVFSVATFFHDFADLRSLEPPPPPATSPFTIANGIEGYTTGLEATAQVSVTDQWRITAGWTELRVHSELKPGSRDVASVRTQALDPNHHASLRSSFDLPGGFELAFTGRYVSAISNQNVPGYSELDVRLGWRPSPSLELSIVGQNLLDEHHAEFGAALTRREIERSVYGKAVWRF